MKAAAILFGLFGSIAAANAGDTGLRSMYPAKVLQTKCRGALDQELMCLDFLRGLATGLAFGTQICPTNGFSNGQLRDIFLGYLAKHPDLVDGDEGLTASAALLDAFPCTAK